MFINALPLLKTGIEAMILQSVTMSTFTESYLINISINEISGWL
jgi:hypothetical protein